MKTKIILMFILTISTLIGNSQNIKTKIKSDTAVVSIIKVMPDSFPNLSVLFNAKNNWGYPVWGIQPNQIKILENKQKCEILQLQQITEKLPINIIVIIDHSTSMISDNYSNLTEYDFYLYKDILKQKSPLTNAKKAISTFLKNFNKPDDKALIIGFSSTVDLVTNFTNNKMVLGTQMNKLEEDGTTAFYDAISMGIDSLIDKKGINVIVALTDGDDNSSILTAQDIIKKSKEYEIPIYIIGLGDIKKNILESISAATNGMFYYTKSSSSLIEVYDNVAKNLKSIYELKYKSNTLDVNNTNRDISMEFDIDSLFVQSSNIKYEIPYNYIQEKIQEEQTTRNYLWGLGIGVLVLGGGSLVVYKIKKRKTIV